MPGTFSYVAATHRAIVTGGGAGPVASRVESQAVGRISS
jgi:hypothetical protein